METQKDIRYFWKVFLSHKKLFFIPFILIFVSSAAIAWLLPSIYESKSTILIEEQQIPPEFVKATVTGFAEQRIQSLTQQILSRTKLWEIIQQFNLYPKMRDKFTREEILEKMRDNIKFETISAEAGGRKGRQAPVTIAFSIAYQGENPAMVQRVTGTLASLYLEQNLKLREEQAKSTTRFLEAELKEIKERLQNLGTQITEYKATHANILPELQQFNFQQAERLETEIKQIDYQIKAAEDRRIYLEGQLATVTPEFPAGTTPGHTYDPRIRVRQLEVALVELQSRFSDDHPDVRKVKRELAELQKVVGDKEGSSRATKEQDLARLQTELAAKQGKYSGEHPEVKQLQKELAKLSQSSSSGKSGKSGKSGTEPENPVYISLATQIQAAQYDVEALKRQKLGLQEKLRDFRHRLEMTPKIEQEYLALQRDYQNAHIKHQDILNKIMEARIAEGMEEHQKGEKFTLVDPASTPERPVSPNRLLIILAGFIVSLGSGLGAVALVETLDHSVRSPEELGWLTRLPVLGTISLIQTAEDLAREIFRRRLIWSITGVSIVLGVVLFHFFYMDIWILAAKIHRVIDKYT